MNFAGYTTLTTEETAERFHTSVANGLAESQITGILARVGKNSLEQKKSTWWRILLSQCKSSFIYLLVAAATLSFSLHEFIDGSMITMFIIITVGLGFYQEYASEQTLALLKQYMVSHVKVRRSGVESYIPNEMVVPGDLIILEAGDTIPADVRFIDLHDATVDESILTGESVPVAKISTPLPKQTSEFYKAKNIGFSGTSLVSGKAEGIVIAGGKETSLGSIATLTSESNRSSGFERELRILSSFIIKLVGVTLVFVLVANTIINGNSTNFFELIIFAVALAVSVVPEGLSLVAIFALSQGARRLAQNKVVVKRLSSVEDLGTIEVLCSDKTGTLTENILRIADVHTKNRELTLSYAGLCSNLNDHSKRANNAFDLAIADALKTSRIHLHDYKKIGELPFDPNRRRNSVLIEHASTQIMIVRGAPESILPFCDLPPHTHTELKKYMESEGALGRRMIAIAYKKLPMKKQYTVDQEEHGLTYAGLISFIDPIKHSTISAIEKAEQLGINVKILTGDSLVVAEAVARAVGLITEDQHGISGEAFEALTSEEQHIAVEKYQLFARISPQQKYTIIRLLQEKWRVGFLGEGINDAPAIKAADVGLVVHGASDIARDAADIVLLRNSLDVIVNGVEEGRKISGNIVKYIRTTMSSNFGNFYSVAIASLLIPYLPMLPLQILLLNLLSDYPMIAISSDTVDASELQKPHQYTIREIAHMALLFGVVSTIFDFVFFALFYRQGAAELQTNWFLGSVITELVFIFSMRSKLPILKASRPSWLLVVFACMAFILCITIPYTSIGHSVFQFISPTPRQLMTVLGVCIAYFFATEGAKTLYYRYLSRMPQPV